MEKQLTQNRKKGKGGGGEALRSLWDEKASNGSFSSTSKLVKFTFFVHFIALRRYSFIIQGRLHEPEKTLFWKWFIKLAHNMLNKITLHVHAYLTWSDLVAML